MTDNEDFVAGAGFAILGSILIGLLVMLAVSFHSCANRESHVKLGSLANPCFANKTCRENLRCVEDGSVPGICVKR